MMTAREPIGARARSNWRRMLVCLVLAAATAGCAGHAPRPADQASSSVPSAPATHIHTPATTTPPTSSEDATLEHALREYYQDWRGVPYRLGGRSRSGIDCSSFVRQTMTAVDSLNLPRTTTRQVRRGQAISRDNLAPGDLVFFRTGRSSRHVGIFVGSGRFMHASSSRGVTISRLDNSYWRRHYWQSRRVTH